MAYVLYVATTVLDRAWQVPCTIPDPFIPVTVASTSSVPTVVGAHGAALGFYTCTMTWGANLVV